MDGKKSEHWSIGNAVALLNIAGACHEARVWIREQESVTAAWKEMRKQIDWRHWMIERAGTREQRADVKAMLDKLSIERVDAEEEIDRHYQMRETDLRVWSDNLTQIIEDAAKEKAISRARADELNARLGVAYQKAREIELSLYDVKIDRARNKRFARREEIFLAVDPHQLLDQLGAKYPDSRWPVRQEPEKKVWTIDEAVELLQNRCGACLGACDWLAEQDSVEEAWMAARSQDSGWRRWVIEETGDAELYRRTFGSDKATEQLNRLNPHELLDTIKARRDRLEAQLR